jgi:hypothetical protein
MPIGRYGTSLLAFFVANWFFPQSLAEPTAAETNRPVIRIASIQQPPERIVIDTSLPTIVRQHWRFDVQRAALPVQAYVSINTETTATGAKKKKGQEETSQSDRIQTSAIGTGNCGRK